MSFMVVQIKREDALDIAVVHSKACAWHLRRDRIHHTIDEGDTVRWVWRCTAVTRSVELECVEGGTPRERRLSARDGVDSGVRTAPQVSLKYGLQSATTHDRSYDVLTRINQEVSVDFPGPYKYWKKDVRAASVKGALSSTIKLLA